MPLTRTLFSLIGLGFVVAGADKLLALRGYANLFRQWGWSKQAMQAVGAAELTGGLLLADERTRHVAGVVLAAASAAVLSAEVRHRDDALALPRLALLAASIAAVLVPVHKQPRRA